MALFFTTLVPHFLPLWLCPTNWQCKKQVLKPSFEVAKLFLWTPFNESKDTLISSMLKSTSLKGLPPRSFLFENQNETRSYVWRNHFITWLIRLLLADDLAMQHQTDPKWWLYKPRNLNGSRYEAGLKWTTCRLADNKHSGGGRRFFQSIQSLSNPLSGKSAALCSIVYIGTKVDRNRSRRKHPRHVAGLRRSLDLGADSNLAFCCRAILRNTSLPRNLTSSSCSYMSSK